MKHKITVEFEVETTDDMVSLDRMLKEFKGSFIGLAEEYKFMRTHYKKYKKYYVNQEPVDDFCYRQLLNMKMVSIHQE